MKLALKLVKEAVPPPPPGPGGPPPSSSAEPDEDFDEPEETDPAEEFETELRGILNDAGMRADTFDECGILTRNRGLVVRTPAGLKFQVAIVHDSRR